MNIRAKSKKWVPLKDALSETLGRMGFKTKIRQYKLWRDWEEIVGPAIALNTRPLRWQGSVLLVGVKHSSWMQELAFLKSEIIEKIKAHIPHIKISDIRFEVKDIPPPQKDKTLKSKSEIPLTGDEEEFISQAASQIKDDDARQTIRELMTLDFKNKKRN